MSEKPRIEILADPEALGRRAAEIFARAARECAGQSGRFVAALAGGSTPRLAHRALTELSARDPLPWDRIHLFWGDERLVPADHPRSNFRMARETLLDGVGIPEANVHPVPTGLASARESASAYERSLRELFGPEAGDLPAFDLIFLGMGSDGHTASLFPGSTLLAERRTLVTSGRVEGIEDERVSLTLPVLNAAARIVFMVSGEGKAVALREAIGQEGEPSPRLPAAMVRPQDGELVWLVDTAAAAGIPRD